MSRRKNLLAICTYPPGHSANAREALDAILASAIFDQSVSVLFCGEGVWQLVPAKDTSNNGDKPLATSLAALPLYDVTDIYADADSLRERGLEEADILDVAKVITTVDARKLLRDCDCPMSF